MSELEILPAPGGAALTPFSPHTGATAAAQHAMSQIQARALIAISRPRDIDTFRQKILKDCRRPGFARAARYDVPNRGSGMSVRFAESCLRHFGNLYVESITVDDNKDALTVRVSVTDLETNACNTQDVTVTKTVERKRKPKNEEAIIDTRFNSFGDTLYILRATSEDVLGKVQSAIAKAKRSLIIKFIPYDIVEECEGQVFETMEQEDAQDPDAALNRMIDAFGGLRVTPADLAEFLGKPLARVAPKDLAELRGIHGALREGTSTWEEIMEAKKPQEIAGTVDTEKPLPEKPAQDNFDLGEAEGSKARGKKK